MASVPLRDDICSLQLRKNSVANAFATTAGSAESLPAYVINGSLRLVRAGCYEYGNDPKRKRCVNYVQLSSPETDKRGVQNLSETDIQAEGLDLNGIQVLDMQLSLVGTTQYFCPERHRSLSLKCACWPRVGVRELNALRCKQRRNKASR